MAEHPRTTVAREFSSASGLVGLAAALLLILTGLLAPSPALGSPSDDAATTIIARGGRVTVRLNDVSLSLLLEALARHTGVLVVVRGLVEGTVTGEVRDLPLDSALRRLLAGCGVAAVYGSSEAAWPTAVWVECPRPAREDGEDETHAFGDVPRHLAEVESLADGRDRSTIDVLASVAHHARDRDVQVEAIRALGRTGHRAAVDALVPLVWTGSTLSRVSAIESLTEIVMAEPAARSAITQLAQAVSDPEPAVQAAAAQGLAAVGEPASDSDDDGPRPVTLIPGYQSM